MGLDLSTIVIVLLNGIANGFLIFLAAAGLTLIFGVMGVINFAHGSMYMLGAYFGFFLVETGFFGLEPLPFWAALLVVPVMVGVVGFAIEYGIIKQIYDQHPLYQLLLTFGIAIVIDNSVRVIWGTDLKSVAGPPLLDFRVQILDRLYPAYNLFLVIAGFLVVVLLWHLLTRTLVGKQIRAASQDREVANALGLNVPLLFTGTFVFGSMLAGLGGILAAPFESVQPSMGETVIIDAFIIIIIGGLGSLPGALVAALLLGVISSAVFVLVPVLLPFIPYLLLIVVVLVYPKGLFGEADAA